MTPTVPPSELTPNRRTHGGQGLIRHLMALPPGHRTQWREVPVTSLDRTVADCLTGFGPLEGLLIADSALRLGADLDAITARIEARAGERGVVTARAGRPVGSSVRREAAAGRPHRRGLGRRAPHDGGSAAPERARRPGLTAPPARRRRPPGPDPRADPIAKIRARDTPHDHADRSRRPSSTPVRRDFAGPDRWTRPKPANSRLVNTRGGDHQQVVWRFSDHCGPRTLVRMPT